MKIHYFSIPCGTSPRKVANRVTWSIEHVTCIRCLRYELRQEIDRHLRSRDRAALISSTLEKAK